MGFLSQYFCPLLLFTAPVKNEKTGFLSLIKRFINWKHKIHKSSDMLLLHSTAIYFHFFSFSYFKQELC